MPTRTTIAKDIKSRIVSQGQNQIYCIRDFADMNNDDAVGRALSRMQAEGMLIRLAQGIYLYPNKSRFGIQQPSLDAIATSVAERDKARIIPSGLTALNALGLSTQIPMNAVYVTNGTPRKINVGNRQIVFKRGCPRLFSYQSELFALVVMAMKEIGEKNITSSEIEQIKSHLLTHLEREKIKNDYLSAPAWMRKCLSINFDEHDTSILKLVRTTSQR